MDELAAAAALASQGTTSDYGPDESATATVSQSTTPLARSRSDSSSLGSLGGNSATTELRRSPSSTCNSSAFSGVSLSSPSSSRSCSSGPGGGYVTGVGHAFVPSPGTWARSDSTRASVCSRIPSISCSFEPGGGYFTDVGERFVPDDSDSEAESTIDLTSTLVRKKYKRRTTCQHTESDSKSTETTTTNALGEGGLPNFVAGHYDKDYWHCTALEGQVVRMIDVHHQITYKVPLARVNKALRYLKVPIMEALLRPGKCRCDRKPSCWQGCGLSLEDLRQLRYIYLQQTTEYAATKFLADYVRASQNFHLQVRKSSSYKGECRRKIFRWTIAGKQVCDKFFCAVFGISADKLQRVRSLLRNPEATVQPALVRRNKPRHKYNQCLAFWNEFFKMCQRPNQHTRLFPVNHSYQTIYDDWFTKWFKKCYPNKVDDMPCLGWMVAARHDKKFADVKDRVNHFHCRCPECARLQALRLNAFKTEGDKQQFEREWEDHEQEKLAWRAFEEQLLTL